MMHEGTLALIAAMMGLLSLSTWASTSGLGLVQPVRSPVSIREGSVRLADSGRTRTRYFIGGGFHGGK